MLVKDDIHRQLNITLAQSSDDPRKHVRRECRTLDPTTCRNEENGSVCCETSLADVFGHTYTNAERILPIMVIRRTFLRPYLSDRDPMYGETRN